jgi:hypothetical protein
MRPWTRLHRDRRGRQNFSEAIRKAPFFSSGVFRSYAAVVAGDGDGEALPLGLMDSWAASFFRASGMSG